ncbi:hypothetical protein [Curtobacterium sp. PhB146]|uniref:hypothetical protein n=1 Tax=Curtobacterium sp. PhB146 TaxID=2485187 RepID=UPI00104A7050|nr:hypothetical protein [Curtobacterium sp. PhB146]
MVQYVSLADQMYGLAWLSLVPTLGVICGLALLALSAGFVAFVGWLVAGAVSIRHEDASPITV